MAFFHSSIGRVGLIIAFAASFGAIVGAGPKIFGFFGALNQGQSTPSSDILTTKNAGNAGKMHREPAPLPPSRSDAIIVERGRDGHYWIDVSVNDMAVIPFLIDTGASDIVLSPQVAEQIGLYLEPSDYTLQFMTANGTIRAAPVSLGYITIGSIELWNVPATVSESDMRVSLLGQSFLNLLQGFEVRGNKMILQP